MTEENRIKTNKYQKGKIYAVRNTDDDDIYIGSTTQFLSKRLYDHKVNSTDTTNNSLLYVKMREVGPNKFYIELIENYPCINREELNRREGEIIRERATLNKLVAGRTRREYMDEYKEYFDNYHREYRQANAEFYKQYTHEYNQKYREQNSERLKTAQREFKQNNPEYFRQKRREYNERHREEINARAKEKRKCYLCGCWVRKGGMISHQNTNKCKSLQKIS